MNIHLKYCKKCNNTYDYGTCPYCRLIQAAKEGTIEHDTIINSKYRTDNK